MSEPILNDHIESELMQRLQGIAASIFARHGIDFAGVQRAGGWTNAVWLADEAVLRLSTTQGSESLLQEAQLARLFSPGVGYPALLESGTTDGFAWTLARRLPGTSLGDVWDDLCWEERAIALHGLWQRAQAVHTVPTAKAARIARQRAWFNSTDPTEAQASLARLTESGIFTAAQSRVLREALDCFWSALPAAPVVLCHGDLTLDNAMWHAGEVVALLDFEFAVMAPVQLDLNHLVKCAFRPEDPAHPLTPADFHGTQQLRDAVKEMALPLLAQPNERELLVGYAILLELWLLELWLAHPEGEGPLEEWAPLRRLRSLADGAGGYLAPLTRDR
jgi:scyllo-inosamine 4-kinase